mgnify:CR=1 FL=1
MALRGSFELVAVDADGRPVRLKLREGREGRQGVSAAAGSDLLYRPLGDPPAVAEELDPVQNLVRLALVHPDARRLRRQLGRIGGKIHIGHAVNKALKDMILGALTNAGGEEYLTRQAEENPQAFMGLIGKVLPTELKGTGEGGSIIVKVVTGLDRD